ncbi:MAG: hypothetical protein NZ602_10645 [Thermoguttaceae bacterium]|nr:hypothetical protein [Thermoguttaceae bacterium]MDW8038951.1 hypothetical protein [Thermoguttaceae bacterium]
MAKLQRVWASLREQQARRVVLILDASSSAETEWNRMLRLAIDVLGQVPAWVEVALYFLGNSSAYSARHLQHRAAEWARENRNRTSLIRPIFDSLSIQSVAKIAVLGSGQIFDLNDWQGHPLAQKTLWCSFGRSVLPPGCRLAEVQNPTPEQIFSHLYDPWNRVQITGPAFMPIWWDSSNYRFSFQDGNSYLEAQHISDFSIQLEALVASPSLEALVEFASGAKDSLVLKPLDPPPGGLSPTKKLTQQEIELFQKACHGQPFTCLHCGKPHTSNTIRCLNVGPILGRCVYPSLPESLSRSFVLFYTENEQLLVRIHSVPVLYLGQNQVAILEHGQIGIYEYQPWSNRWIKKTDSTFQPYHCLEGGARAIFL